ncbi:unnamed protein product [Blepharisma stoltei]|uniref:Origin recognition complex subunit 4 n=1 Tax=Blepharisma stoltei TaxID=1481888 RepID=A0AAU9K9G2_9CILI|nr:unnamed protein product [Blepharisma stoltei]
MESCNTQLRNLFDMCYDYRQSQCILMMGQRGNYNDKIIDKALENKHKPIIIKISGILASDDVSAFQTIVWGISQKKGLEYKETSIQYSLEFLKENLSPSDKILIIIKDIEEFAHKTIKQVFLYTLFELIHTEICMLCILGITPNLNFVEMLEKRIRSRLSCQIVLVSPAAVEDEANQFAKDLGRMTVESREDKKLANIKQLKPIELMVFACFLKVIERNNPLTLHSAYGEFLKFMLKRPVILYNLDKFTFKMISKRLQKLKLFTIKKKCTILSYSELTATFDVETVIGAIRDQNIELSTAAHEWFNN